MPGKFEFTHQDSTERQRWQTAKGDTKADAKAERAEMLARLHRGERVVRQQVLASADPTRRPLGETKLRDVTVDHVAAWSQGNEQALAPSTAWPALIAMNQMCRFAVRRGWIGVNPVAPSEPGEKPRWRVEHVRILERVDLGKLLEHAAAYRAMFEFLAYTGLRIGEALGLRWCDVDFEAAVLRVRQQLSRQRTPKHLKTEAARREVVLAPAVRRLLRAASFPLPLGGEGMVRGSRPREPTTAASLLIAKGLNVVFVSRQLGHANPALTPESTRICSSRPTTR